jgi:hypothetical protein
VKMTLESGTPYTSLKGMLRIMLENSQKLIEKSYQLRFSFRLKMYFSSTFYLMITNTSDELFRVKMNVAAAGVPLLYVIR